MNPLITRLQAEAREKADLFESTMDSLQSKKAYIFTEDNLDTLIEHAVSEARNDGIRIARKHLRSSQEDCMCHEKNLNQMERLLDGRFGDLDALSPDKPTAS